MLSPGPRDSVTLVSWQWRVSVRCDVWQGTRSRWSPHSWQCPRDILFVSSNCQEFWDNTKPSVRLIKISFFSDLDTFSSSFLNGGRLVKSVINIFRWPADVQWIQSLNEQIFSMSILSASLLSAKNSPGGWGALVWKCWYCRAFDNRDTGATSWAGQLSRGWQWVTATWDGPTLVTSNVTLSRRHNHIICLNLSLRCSQIVTMCPFENPLKKPRISIDPDSFLFMYLCRYFIEPDY